MSLEAFESRSNPFSMYRETGNSSEHNESEGNSTV